MAVVEAVMVGLLCGLAVAIPIAVLLVMLALEEERGKREDD